MSINFVIDKKNKTEQKKKKQVISMTVFPSIQLRS